MTTENTLILETFGKRVTEIRNILKMNQRAFAASLKASGSFVSEIEHGKVRPGFNFFYHLMSIHNVNPGYLFFGEGDIFNTEKNEPETTLDISPGMHDPVFVDLINNMNKSDFVRLSILQYFVKLSFEFKDLISHELKLTRSREDTGDKKNRQ
ncbi:MAG: helix-turn-helix transcriptional regulator [Ketobacter sp.]|nr:helix-turn-helix transcriptional regulator [Ketobacter sp.]